MKKPARLEKGMTIGLTAPCGAVRDKAVPDRYAAFLEARGYSVEVGRTCRAAYGYLAGEDSLRADELNGMFADRKIDAVFCVRGGYGAARILDRLDLETIRDNPKIFLGFSDVTALHTVLNNQCGLVTFHGPNGDVSSGRDGCDISMECLIHVLAEPEKYRILENPRENKAKCVVPGKAGGIMTGGNLTVLSRSLGTRWQPDFDGKLIFIEDVNEPVYKIDGMLTQLAQAGAFDMCKGIIFGGFNGCRNAYPEFAFSIDEVIQDTVQKYGKPVISGFMCGHFQPMLTLPFGTRCLMDAERGTIEMVEIPVE